MAYVGGWGKGGRVKEEGNRENLEEKGESERNK